MGYTLLFDKEFVKEYNKLGNSVRAEAEKKLKRLKDNPHEIGKPLKYFPNLYELHVRMYRIFYLGLLVYSTPTYDKIRKGNIISEKRSDDFKAVEFILNNLSSSGKIYTHNGPMIAYYSGLNVKGMAGGWVNDKVKIEL